MRDARRGPPPPQWVRSRVAGLDDPWRGVPRLVLPDDALGRVLKAASVALLKHPAAVQSAFSAFVAEGRRFAETSEGRRWRASLADSLLVQRGRALWDGSVLNTLEDSPDTVLPSTILDAIVQAAGRNDLTAFLQQLHEQMEDTELV